LLRGYLRVFNAICGGIYSCDTMSPKEIKDVVSNIPIWSLNYQRRSIMGVGGLFSKRGQEALIKIVGSDENATSRKKPESAEVTGTGVLLRVSDIAPNPFQSRKFFDEQRLIALSASLKDRGVLQPIIVRKTGESSYELIAGERRLKAAKLAGLTEVPAIVKELGDRDMKVYTIVENLQREDLTVAEKTIAIGSLQDEIGDTGVTAEELRLTRRSVERYVMIYKVVSSSATLLSLFQRNTHAIDFRAAENIANIGRYLSQDDLNKFVDLANREGIAQAIKRFRRPLSAIFGSKGKSHHVFCVTKETENNIFYQARYEKGAKVKAEDRQRLQQAFEHFLSMLQISE
jgi:ParB/RepB/Spo0J family partition protein